MQVHVEDISHVESSIGDDKKRGTWIYLRGRSEPCYCLETARKIREMIEEARSKEEIQLDAVAIGLLLKAANKSADGRLHFTATSDGLTVTAGGVRMEPLQGRDRSKYEHAERQMSWYALVLSQANPRGFNADIS
jgi:hypothetical protein